MTEPGATQQADDDVLTWLALLHDRVAGLVEHRSSGDPTAADPLRGLFLSPEAIDHLLHRPPLEVPAGDGYAAAARTPSGRLRLLMERFGLTGLDLHLLLVALAPDVDRRFEPLYGYLNDDVSRRRATVDLALTLTGLQPQQAAARARLYPDAPLRAGDLLILDDDPGRPLPSRSLRVPERVIGYLLGDDALDESLLDVVQLLSAGSPPAAPTSPPETTDPPPAANRPPAAGPDPFTTRLTTLLSAETSATLSGTATGETGTATGEPARGTVVVHLLEHRPGSGTEAAVAALLGTGRPVLRFDPDHRIDPHRYPLPSLIREARLRAAAIVAGPLPEDRLAVTALVRSLEQAPGPVVLVGREPYDPSWSATGAPLPLEAPDGSLASTGRWAAELGPEAGGLDIAGVVAPYRLGPEQVRRAARSARALAVLDGRPLSATHVQQAARRQSAPVLDRHARRVSPGVDWTGLVLPAEPLAALHELVLRARQRDRVLGDWRMRSGGGRGRGVVALFAGESGTGKTLSAEVVAGELGLDLYVVQLSGIVDKYIGETEKNLERIFSEADHSDGVLLFDEADAVFGKRSEVKDSHDKYANLQSAYLLQRLESFDGIALLTTNLRANIDEAFTRRLDLVVDFPFPDAAHRNTLWRHCLAAAPCAPDLDLTSPAARFELSGGAIHSAAVTAAYLAAGRDGLVTTADVLAGAEREYRKMGRLLVPVTR